MISQGIIGAALLFLGRPLYWLFLALVGFLLTYSLLVQHFNVLDHWIGLGIALFIAVLGGMAAVMLQKATIAIAGLIGGGLLAFEFSAALGPEQANYRWLIVLVAAIIGAILMSLIFELTLTVISALIGADLLVELLPVTGAIQWGLVAIVTLIGITVQTRIKSKPKD